MPPIVNSSLVNSTNPEVSSIYESMVTFESQPLLASKVFVLSMSEQ